MQQIAIWETLFNQHTALDSLHLRTRFNSLRGDIMCRMHPSSAALLADSVPAHDKLFKPVCLHSYAFSGMANNWTYARTNLTQLYICTQKLYKCPMNASVFVSAHLYEFEQCIAARRVTCIGCCLHLRVIWKQSDLVFCSYQLQTCHVHVSHIDYTFSAIANRIQCFM